MASRTADCVADRLRASPGVQVVEGAGLDLFVRQNFVTPVECAALIAVIDSNRRPSTVLATVLATDVDPTFRTSESCDLDRCDQLVSRIDRRVAGFLGLDERQGETLQGQRYAVGQQFKAHHDWFDLDYWTDEHRRGGQRTWTAMIYLDEPVAGGETWFSAAGLKVTPTTGMLVTWNNIGPDGSLQSALHESLPVIAGVKTIVTKWFREREWC